MVILQEFDRVHVALPHTFAEYILSHLTLLQTHKLIH